MKIAIHPGYGIFRLPQGFMDLYGYHGSEFNDNMEIRTNPNLINFIENNANCSLGVATIPDNATDHMIEEYDGSERIVYVENGKLHIAYAD